MNAKAMRNAFVIFVFSVVSIQVSLAEEVPEFAPGTVGGVVPSPIDTSGFLRSYQLRDQRRGRKRDALPTKWDSRDHGWVTSIKNQGSYGTCWAYATMASMETALKKNGHSDGGGDWDFSENHMAKHNVGFLWNGFTQGGNNSIATALLTSWRDPLRETDDPYGHPDSTNEGPAVKHVQNFIFLPARSKDVLGTRITSIQPEDEYYKRAVMEYGAVAISYQHFAKVYGNNGTHYLPVYSNEYYTAGKDGGHAVTLIGWDDDYSASNFNYTPPGNGAFLCKNSWGNTGDSGCIWISYYDSCLFSAEGAAYPEPEPANNYGKVYEYDPCGFTATWNVYYEGDTCFKSNWCANVFTSAATGIVEAVGFPVVSANLEYEIRVYRHCGAGPGSGTLVSSQQGTADSIGYRTVRLVTPVAVGARERFAVAVRFEASDTDYPIPVSQSLENYCITTADRGESFMSGDGIVWEDMQDRPDTYRDENVCIKAYTRYGADGEAATAQTLYVDRSYEGNDSDGTVQKPFKTISAALASAMNGDSILVMPGVYCESVDSKTGVVEIRSAQGPEVTIIDGGGENYCYDGEYNQDMLLYGFTLRNGYAQDCGAGAIGGRLSHCIVSNCFVNGSYNVGAAGVYGSVCDNTLIVRNESYSPYGYIYGGGACSSTLVNCTVADNYAHGAAAIGGGICGCNAYNSIIACNRAESSYKGYGGGPDADWTEVNPPIKVFSDGDPHFVDPANGDYRLRPDSPCIDAGFAQALADWGLECDTDLAGAARLAGWEIDQGCYEYSQEVRFRDWTLYASYALQTNELVIAAEGRWELETDDDWLNPLVVSGYGCATVKVEVAANTTGEYRYGTVYLYGAGADYEDWCDFVQSAKTTRGEKHYGLFVGINEYSSKGVPPLTGCVNDATKMREQALASGLWHEENTTFLTNATARMTTIRSALTGYAAVAQPGDTVLYYQAGHGSGPDCYDQSAISLCTYDANYQDYTLAADLAAFRSGVKMIVITDVCLSGGLFKTNAWSRAERTFAERMNELVYGPAFIAAADYDQSSWDGDSLYDIGVGGYFTVAFTEGWRTGAADADGDGKLNFLELVEYAAARARGFRDNRVDYWTEAQFWNATLLAEGLAGYVPGVWPEIEIKEGDSDAMKTEKLQDALFGAGLDARVAAHVTEPAQYEALAAWSAEKGVGMPELGASSTALISAALGADALLELSASDIGVTGFSPSSVPGSYSLRLSLDAYDRLKANAALLRAAVNVIGASEPGAVFSDEDLSFTITPGDEAIEVTVMPPEASPQYFFRARVR